MRYVARGVSRFSERNDFFRERPDRFGFRQRRFDALMLDQTANLIGEQRFAMLSGAAS